MKNPIIIIGSGLAGYVLAKEFRKLNQNIPLQIITASDGRFYSKPQLSTALTANKTPEAIGVADAETMEKELNASILTHTKVTAIHPEEHTISIDSEKIPYSKLVLACGAEIIKPPLIGNAVSELLHVNDLEDYAKFRNILHGKKHLAILGAGLVGCEFANDLANAGHQVEIIAPSNYLIDSFLPEPIGLVLQEALEKQGVKMHLAQNPVSLDKIEKGYVLKLSSERELLVDLVFSAIGLRPHTELANKTNIKVNRGIAVDRNLQTSATDVYALGDCAEVNGLVLLFVAPLLNCARALAQTLAGTPTQVVYPAMPVVIKTPACPIAVSPPPRGLEGEWKISGEGKNLKALFYDKNFSLRGFALTGNTVREKQALVKELPMIFE